MKAYYVSLGCAKNTVDMEAALSLLKINGHEITNDSRSADIYIVNACSFLKSAWEETVQEVDRLARLKSSDLRKKIIVMGCLPPSADKILLESLTAVDHFLHPGRHGELPTLLHGWEKGANPSEPELSSPNGVGLFAGFERRELLTPGHTAYLKISDGCSHLCEFCSIPRIRGAMISRDFKSILREVRFLADSGVREISIIAQDPAAYNFEGVRLPDLVEKIAATGIEWLRILYIHPVSMRIEDFKRILEIPAVCRYMDVPIQHVSDRILERMNRGYDSVHVLRLLNELREFSPDLEIRSEVIVGYPGESEEDFDKLSELVSGAGFAALGIFPFSPEEGTAAALRPDRVDSDIVSARCRELASIQEVSAYNRNSRKIGKIFDVLVDNMAFSPAEGARNIFSARYYGQAYEIDGTVNLAGKNLHAGDFVRALITGADACDLEGRVEGDEIP